jgi:hypothetical protein
VRAVVLQDAAAADRLVPPPVGVPGFRAPCVAGTLRREPGPFEDTDLIVNDPEQPLDGRGISVVVRRMESATSLLGGAT